MALVPRGRHSDRLHPNERYRYNKCFSLFFGKKSSFPPYITGNLLVRILGMVSELLVSPHALLDVVVGLKVGEPARLLGFFLHFFLYLNL